MSDRRSASHPSHRGQLVVLDDDPRLHRTFVVQVDFGHATGGEADFVVVPVAADWITETSRIVCSPAATATPDHDPLDVVVEGIIAYPMNIEPGVGFDVAARAPQQTWGRYYINVIA